MDTVLRPLVQPYLGPFDVLQKSAKTFVILQNGKNVTVTVDRLKPPIFYLALTPRSLALVNVLLVLLSLRPLGF